MKLWNSTFIFFTILVFVLISSICYCNGAKIRAKVKSDFERRWSTPLIPRRGRSGIDSGTQSPDTSLDSSVLFWGPQLRRLQKRALELTDQPWSPISLQDYQPRIVDIPSTSLQAYTPRTESDPVELLKSRTFKKLYYSPRLGRSPEFSERLPKRYTPRMGRSSEEILDDFDDVLDEKNNSVEKSLQK